MTTMVLTFSGKVRAASGFLWSGMYRLVGDFWLLLEAIEDGLLDVGDAGLSVAASVSSPPSLLSALAASMILCSFSLRAGVVGVAIVVSCCLLCKTRAASSKWYVFTSVLLWANPWFYQWVFYSVHRRKGNFSCTAATVRNGTVVRWSLRASTGQDWFNSKYSTVVVYLQTVRNVRVDSVQYRNREVSYAREDYDTVLYGCTVTWSTTGLQ